RVRENRFECATLDDGSQLEADACIAAVTHDVLPGLLPREMSGSGSPLEGLRHIKTSPITGVHLWFDRVVMAEPFLTLLDHTTQWVFNKTLLYATAETDGSNVRPTDQSIEILGNGGPG